MNISSNRETLIKGLQTIQSGFSPKSRTIPILQNFLMETESEGLKVVFTDLEMAIKHYINVHIKNDGSITIPIGKFSEILHVLSEDEDILISTDDSSKVLIKSGKSKFRIIGTQKSEYPVIPDIDETNSFNISASTLSDIIKKTIFSASTEDVRRSLNGLLWKYSKNNLHVAATDGRRLALIVKSGIKIKENFKIVIPSKILIEIVRFIDTFNTQADKNILVGISSNQIGFKIDKTVFISKLLEENFPNYEDIIPKNKEFSIEINTEKMLTVTKRASICSTERGGFVKYSFKKGVLIVTAASHTIDFEDEVDIDYHGKEFDIAFEPRFIIDILKNTQDKSIIFDFTAPSNPVVVRVPHDNNLLYMIMPLKIQ